MDKYSEKLKEPGCQKKRIEVLVNEKRKTKCREQDQ